MKIGDVVMFDDGFCGEIDCIRNEDNRIQNFREADTGSSFFIVRTHSIGRGEYSERWVHASDLKLSDRTEPVNFFSVAA